MGQIKLLVALLFVGSVFGQAKGKFSVCADPENFPFSSRNLEGFENKIADLIAKELGTSPSYIWWGQRRGFIRNTMNATLEEGRCDVVIGVPQGYDLVRTTKPYYRSTYVFVYPKDKGLQIKSLDDPVLKKLKIGVHLLGDDYTNPPPVHELSKRGIVGNVVGFDTFYSAQNPPGRIIDAVVTGQIHVAIVWGPAAGYFAKHASIPLQVIPVPSGKGDLPFAFDISMGVKPGNDALRTRLEQVLARRQGEIRKILQDFGVPLLQNVNAKAASFEVQPAQARADTYKDVYSGWRWWHVYCYRCHGVDAVGTTNAPGFLDPSKRLTRAEFLRKVRNGVPETAMQAWNKLLDDNQIVQIYTYVMARADKVLPAGRPDEVGPNGGQWIPPQGWPKQK